MAWIDVNATIALPQPGTPKIDSSTTAGAGTFDDACGGSYPVIAVDPPS